MEKVCWHIINDGKTSTLPKIIKNSSCMRGEFLILKVKKYNKLF